MTPATAHSGICRMYKDNYFCGTGTHPFLTCTRPGTRLTRACCHARHCRLLYNVHRPPSGLAGRPLVGTVPAGDRWDVWWSPQQVPRVWYASVRQMALFNNTTQYTRHKQSRSNYRIQGQGTYPIPNNALVLALAA